MYGNPMMLGYVLGGGEVALIVLVGALLVYGKRLPELGRSMGRSIVEFKKGLSGRDDDEKTEPGTPDKPGHDAGKSS